MLDGTLEGGMGINEIFNEEINASF